MKTRAIVDRQIAEMLMLARGQENCVTMFYNAPDFPARSTVWGLGRLAKGRPAKSSHPFWKGSALTASGMPLISLRD